MEETGSIGNDEGESVVIWGNSVGDIVGISEKKG